MAGFPLDTAATDPMDPDTSLAAVSQQAIAAAAVLAADNGLRKIVLRGLALFCCGIS